MKQRRHTCKKCGVKKYEKFMSPKNGIWGLPPQRGGWGHSGWWECIDIQKCEAAQRAIKHVENRG